MSESSISQLYSTATTFTKPITGLDNKGKPITFDVEVRRIPFSELNEYLMDRESEDRKIRLESTPKVLSRAIRFDGGQVRAKPEEIAAMDGSTVDSLLTAFLSVNKTKGLPDLGNA